MTTGLHQPLRDLNAALQAVLDRVRADADGSGLEVELRVDPGFAVPGGVDDRSPVHQVVGVIGEHVFAAGFEHGLEAACAAVMSVVQDDLVGMRGRPWPEIADGDGSALGVLDVACEPLGIAHWSHRGRPLCAVGHLSSTCRALGWRVR
jgi:hypothetical protein